LIISRIQRLPAFNFKKWETGGAAALVDGDKDRILAEIDHRFSRLLKLVMCTLKPYEMENPAVRKLALQFLGQAIARYSPNYLHLLELTVKLCGVLVFAPPSRTEDVWLEIESGWPDKVRYRVMFWPDIAVFVPKTKTTFESGSAVLVERRAARLMDEKAATRNIQQRYLLMGRTAGEEWWRTFRSEEALYGKEIPAIEVCAQITAQVGACKEYREAAGMYLQRLPADKRRGSRAYVKAAKSLHIEDIYQTLREMG
jgi:hypothetical protein